jgi:hypothetical protein
VLQSCLGEAIKQPKTVVRRSWACFCFDSKV